MRSKRQFLQQVYFKCTGINDVLAVLYQKIWPRIKNFVITLFCAFVSQKILPKR